MFDYSLEHIVSYWARLERPQLIGPTPEGLRAVFPVARPGPLGSPVRRLRSAVACHHDRARCILVEP